MSISIACPTTDLSEHYTDNTALPIRVVPIYQARIVDDSMQAYLKVPIEPSPINPRTFEILNIELLLPLVTLHSGYQATMLYTNATIITVNAKREIILNGAILVSGVHIADIGKTGDLTARYPDEPAYDLTGHIVIPGLISTHMHTAQTLLR